MKKLLLLQTVFWLSAFSISFSNAQSAIDLNKAYEYILKQYGLDRTAIGELAVKSQYLTRHNQVNHVTLVQTFKGTEILGTSINLAVLPDGKILSSVHRLTTLDGFAVSNDQAVVAPVEAISLAAGSLGLDTRSVSTFKKMSRANVPMYENRSISLQDIPVEMGFLHMPSGDYRLVYKMQIESGKHGEYFESYVDAGTGTSIANESLTLHCSFEDGYLQPEHTCSADHIHAEMTPSPSAPMMAGQYRALPRGIESPNHGAFELISGIEDPIASPYGWHDIDGDVDPDYTYTRGNNVHAFLDRNWDYLTDGNVDGGASLVFDFPYNETAEPSGNQNAAVTNLFVWNNIMHDFAYNYGFDEVSGNFQDNNYTNQGEEQDYVEAHAQFGDNNPTQCGTEANGGTACLNNADFSTPTDGLGGRMRMFTWDRDNSSKFLDIIEPIDLAGKILTGAAQFGPDITSAAVTGEMVIMDDGTFNGPKGCEPVSGIDYTGKIVLIERGLCDFSLKAYNAQEAGAIGAIICNFEDAVIGMAAGENAELVTIPTVLISSVEYERIRIAVGNGLVGSLVAPSTGGPALRDGSLDNSVIAHEFAHGISTRLTGGPNDSGCLRPSGGNMAEEASGMGEGWSDFFALVTTAQPGDTGPKRRGIGTYANKEETNGRGIRTFPYSTDMTINPHTYDNILLESLPHGVGSVWCAMLWDLYWALTDKYGWDPDLYNGTGGNNLAIQLVMDGLKLQPCRPGFIDARNAILQADSINNGGANQGLIWSVFARRGLGADANGGDPNLRADGTQGFALPIEFLDEIRFSKAMTPEVLAGENIEVTLKIVNYKDFPMSNVVIEDPVPDGCTYLPGSANIEPVGGNNLVWTIPTMEPDEELTITYLLQTDPQKKSIRMLYDDIEGLAEERWDIYFDPDGTVTNFWFQQDAIVKSGTAAWSVSDIATESQHYLQNYDPYTITGDYPVYRFYHYYNTETGADGGFMEISTDDGDSWIPLESEVFRNGYPRKLQYTTFAIPNLFAFSGVSSPDQKMIPTYIDLRDFIGEDVKIRFRFGTDDNTPGDGWYVDDVEIMDAVLYNSLACVTSDQTDPVCAEAPARGTIVDSQIASSTGDVSDGPQFLLMPNPAKDMVQIIMTTEHAGDAEILVYSLTGQQIDQATWNLTTGINQAALDVSGYSPGMYVVQIVSGKAMKSEKFVRE